MTTRKVSAREPFVTVTLPSSISGPRLLYRILRAAGHSQMFFLGWHSHASHCLCIAYRIAENEERALRVVGVEDWDARC